MIPMDVEEAQVVQRLTNKLLEVTLTAVTAEDPCKSILIVIART